MARKKKYEAVPIHTLEDAVNLLNSNSQFFDKAIKKLSRKSNRLTILSIVAVGYAIYATYECKKQEEELYRLSVRVNKLENKEGA